MAEEEIPDKKFNALIDLQVCFKSIYFNKETGRPSTHECFSVALIFNSQIANGSSDLKITEDHS